MADAILKRCCQCEQRKELSEFYGDKRAADGLYRCCKSCHREKTQRWKKNNPDKVRAEHVARYASKRDHILAVTREWEIANKDRKNAVRRERMRADPERWANKTREWRMKNPEAARKTSVDSYWRNHERSLATLRRYKVDHPEVMQRHEVARRTAKTLSQPAWANEFFISEAYRLAKLREKVCGGKWHVDHTVPLRSKIVCGLHVEQNLQVVPALANQRKSNRHWPDMP